MPQPRHPALPMLAGALAFVAALAGSPATAAEPAFDCSAAEGEIETLICADEALARHDRRLAERFKQALGALRDTADEAAAVAELRAYQRGWIKGRNDCWKAEDERACTEEAYLRREGELVALYFLEGARAVDFWMCEDNPANEIVTYFFDLERPAVRLERGDMVDTGLLVPTASGSKYEASFGRSVWIKGPDMRLEWPPQAPQSCVVVEERP